MARPFKPLPNWYRADLTIAEMSEISGHQKGGIRKFLQRRNLPYIKKRIDTEGELEWYDPSLTVDEMAAKSKYTTTRISWILNKRNLPFKEKPKEIPEWYNPNSTAKEMAIRAGIGLKAVYIILNAKGLEYKKITKKPGGPRPRKFTIDDFMKFYNKNLTVQEMHKISKIPTSNIRGFISVYKLPFKRLARKLIIGDWYREDRTISEMAYLSGLEPGTVSTLLYRRNLPHSRKKY